jgi:type II secretory ATPase GspE/PulE/Tfp pilus assembly ATPase PilB-like protein
VGVFELVVISEELREAIGRGAPQSELRALAERSASSTVRDGARNGTPPAGAEPNAVGSYSTTLRADGWAKAVAGLTTIEEVLRVVQS